jgi:hypothetical protein
MRCDMKIEKAAAGSGTTNEANKTIDASIEFAVRASLHDSATNFPDSAQLRNREEARYQTF